MAVVILDQLTGQQVPLAQVAGGSRPILTFEMTAGGARPLSDFIARPDTLRLFDMVSRASLTYNQALAADAGNVPARALTFSDRTPLQFSDGKYLELMAA